MTGTASPDMALCAVAVGKARDRLDLARAAYAKANIELRSAEDGVREAEEKFADATWRAFGLEHPFERFRNRGYSSEGWSIHPKVETVEVGHGEAR